MLVLARAVGESIFIGNDVKVTILDINVISGLNQHGMVKLKITFTYIDKEITIKDNIKIKILPQKIPGVPRKEIQLFASVKNVEFNISYPKYSGEFIILSENVMVNISAHKDKLTEEEKERITVIADIKIDDAVFAGDFIKIMIADSYGSIIGEIGNEKARIAIEAPSSLSIKREEIFDKSKYF